MSLSSTCKNRQVSHIIAACAGIVVMAVLVSTAFPGIALADEGSGLFGLPIPNWMSWGLPAIISIGLGLAALFIFIISKAQGTWNQGSGNKKRRGQRRR